MKAKIFLSSIVTIALCLSLIVGSTFALFETEKKVNIAVTAGKLDVEATIPPEKVDASGMLCYDKQDPYANAFSDGKVLTISKMVPGDTVTFKIQVANASNIPMKYRVVATSADNPENDPENKKADLSEVLVSTATFYKNNGQTKLAEKTLIKSSNSEEDRTFKTEYYEVLTSEKDVVTIEVTVTFPVADNNNAYKEAVAALTFTVEAVQADR